MVDSVNVRWEQKSFPIILPEELNEKDFSAAKDTYDVARAVELEYVELQSFIESKYARHCADSPADEGLCEGVRRANWARMTYWPLCGEFTAAKSLREIKLVHRFVGDVFVPMVPLGSVTDPDIVSLARHLWPLVREEDLIPVDFRFFGEWMNFRKLLVMMEQDLMVGFRTFLRAKY